VGSIFGFWERRGTDPLVFQSGNSFLNLCLFQKGFTLFEAQLGSGTGQVDMMVPGYPTRMHKSKSPISIPNSKAEVDTTAKSSPEASFFSIILRSSGKNPALASCKIDI